jgi:hypothetical protein
MEFSPPGILKPTSLEFSGGVFVWSEAEKN